MGRTDRQLDGDRDRESLDERLAEVLGESPEEDGDKLLFGFGKRELYTGLAVFGFFFVLTLAGALVYGLRNPGTVGSTGGISRLFDSSAQAAEPLERAFDKRGEITLLLAGIDSEPPHRSDTVMLVGLSTDSKRVKMLSLPRDTLVHIPPVEGKWNGGSSKLAHAYAWGDAPTLRKTVAGFTGISPDRYMVIDFQGFVRAVDALGGVDLNVEQDMHYVDNAQDLSIHIDQGRQHLDGEQALKYARFRQDKLGDLGRMHRQQKLLKTLFNQSLQPERVSRLPGTARELYGAVNTDMSLDELNALRKHFTASDQSGKLEARTLPSEPTHLEGISYQSVTPEDVREHREWLLKLDPEPEEESEAADDETEAQQEKSKEESVEETPDDGG